MNHVDTTRPHCQPSAEWRETTLTQQGFSSQCTISVRADASGQRRYTGLWSNQGAPSELRRAYAGFELVQQPQWDVAVDPAAKLADPLESFRQQLTQIEKLPAEILDEPQVRQARAAARLPAADRLPITLRGRIGICLSRRHDDGSLLRGDRNVVGRVWVVHENIR